MISDFIISGAPSSILQWQDAARRASILWVDRTKHDAEFVAGITDGELFFCVHNIKSAPGFQRDNFDCLLLVTPSKKCINSGACADPRTVMRRFVQSFENSDVICYEPIRRQGELQWIEI